MTFNVSLDKLLAKTRNAISVPLDKIFERVKDAISKEAEIKSDLQEKNHTKCPHHFGYLAELCKNKPIPEECFFCSKVVECIASL